MTDEEILRAFVAGDDAASQAVERVLARLAAAEKVADMVRVSLSPKLRQSAEKKTYWFDVAVAIKQWQETRESGATSEE